MSFHFFKSKGPTIVFSINNRLQNFQTLNPQTLNNFAVIPPNSEVKAIHPSQRTFSGGYLKLLARFSKISLSSLYAL